MAQISAATIMRAVLSSDRIGVSAEPSRRGDAQWAHGDLEFRAWLDRTPEGQMRCETNVGDAKFGQAMDKYGRLSVMLRTQEPPRKWPEGRALSGADLDWAIGEFAVQFSFLETRRDLCESLAAKSDIHRGSVYAWLPLASYPARLVQSLIIARDAGFSELEDSILDSLRSGPIVLADGRDLDVANSAKHWAKQYSKALGFEVSL